MVGFYFFSKTVIGFIGIVGFPQYIHFWVWKNPITTSRMMFQTVNFRLTLLMPLLFFPTNFGCFDFESQSS